MKRLIATVTLCAVLLGAMLMPASAASCPDQTRSPAEALTLIIKVLQRLGEGNCSVELPTQPAEPTCPGDPSCPTEPVQPTEPVCPGDPGCPTEPTEPTAPAEDDPVRAFEKEVVRLVNEIRAQYGLGALTENTALSDVAREKSRDMLANRYFDHQSPTYGSPFDMMRTFGISYRTAGENIAVGYTTPAAVVEGWMASQGHRENILGSGFAEIGVGYVVSGHYWTQMFIG